MLRGARWVRQLIYALILLAAVMGLARLQWLGMPALERYVVFFLTEPMDLGQIQERLSEWLPWPPEDWSLPWQRLQQPVDAPEVEAGGRRGAPEAGPQGAAPGEAFLDSV